jgi:hypothetical protein
MRLGRFADEFQIPVPSRTQQNSAGNEHFGQLTVADRGSRIRLCCAVHAAILLALS